MSDRVPPGRARGANPTPRLAERWRTALGVVVGADVSVVVIVGLDVDHVADAFAWLWVLARGKAH